MYPNKHTVIFRQIIKFPVLKCKDTSIIKKNNKNKNNPIKLNTEYLSTEVFCYWIILNEI